MIALVAGLVGGGVWWLVNRDNSGQASATSSPGTSTVRPTEIRTQPAPTPQRLNSVNRASPGCDESDSRVVWKTIRGDVSCSSTAMTLTKRVGWDDGYLQSYAELRMSLREQQLPDSFTVSFTISGLSAPELEVNRGGCGGLAVHTTPDGRTYDYFNICADGWVEFVRVVGNTGVDNETRQLTPAPHQGSSPSYSVIVSVSASRVEVTVSNQVGESTSISSPVVGGTTSYLALMTTWRNVGATASFSDFTYSAAG